MTRLLVVTDVHACPNDPDLARYARLTDLVYDVDPDLVIHLGDDHNWDSVKSHIAVPEEQYSTAAEEIKTARQCQSELFSPSVHGFRSVFLEGNHEYRWPRLSVTAPQRYEDIDFDIQQLYEEHGWEYIQYRKPYVVDNCMFTHAVIGGTGKPIGGVYAARNQALMLGPGQVCFSGHLHTFQVQVVPSMTHQPPKAAFVCPWFKTCDEQEPYAIGMPNRNVAGVMVVETRPDSQLPWFEMIPFEDI